MGLSLVVFPFVTATRRLRIASTSARIWSKSSVEPMVDVGEIIDLFEDSGANA
jgi:hypothetical protein